MYSFSRSVALAFLSVISVAACVGSAPRDRVSSSCSAGEKCNLSGKLTILRGMPASVGILETAAGCVPLALPQQVYARSERWNDKRVKVAGPSFSYGVAENVLWIAIMDRKVATGACDNSPVIVYVTGIKRL